MRVSVLFHLLLLCVMIISCKDDESALRPAFIDPITPKTDNLYLNEGPYFVSVRVTNENKAPLPNILVTFTIKEGDAKLTTANMHTDANGVAYTSISGNPKTGPIILEAATSGLSNKAVFNYGVSKSRTSQIRIIAGNNQEVLADAPAITPLKVKVMDDLGNIAKDVSVKFIVLAGNGTVDRDMVQTDQNGEASTNFTGSNTISNTVAAVVEGDSAFFTLESLSIGSLSVVESGKGIDVTWSKNKVTRFQKYTLHRAGSDGIYKQIAEFTAASDTMYTDTSSDLIINSAYTYKLIVHTLSSSVEKTMIIVFGEFEFVKLQERAIDFEMDESRNQLYVSLPELNEIHVFNLTTHELKDKIPIGSKPHGISLSHDKSTLYVALFGSGAVAFLNLATKQVTQLDVSDELGDLKAFDVLEGAPGRVFVTANPEHYGISYLIVIKTDENNAVERFMEQVVRIGPTLAADYGKFIYLIEGNRLYKLDPYGSYTDPTQEGNYNFSSSRRFVLINPAGTKLYLDFEALNTNPISAAGSIGSNVPALSPDGSVVHYHAASTITSYNTSTLQKIKETGFYVNYLKKLALTPDNATFVALGVDYALTGDVVYFIRNME